MHSFPHQGCIFTQHIRHIPGSSHMLPQDPTIRFHCAMEYLVPRPPWLDWLSPPPPPPPPARLAHRPGVTLRSADCWRAHFFSSSSSSPKIFLHLQSFLLLSFSALVVALPRHICHLGPTISRPLMRASLFNIPYLHNPLPYLKPIWWLLAFPSSFLTPSIIYVGPFLELPFSF